MKGISVPKQYKHELRSSSTPEYKIAQIRDYVKAHPNKVLKGGDFEDLIGSSGTEYVRKLIRQGRLTRKNMKDGHTRGVHYSYRWHEVTERVEEDKHGQVRVTSLGFEPWPLIAEHGHKHMAEEMSDYIEDKLEELPAEQIKGMLLFKKHINSKYKEVEAQRKKILEGGENEDGKES